MELAHRYSRSPMNNENSIFTWYTFAQEIFSEFHLDKSEYENYDRPFKLIKPLLRMYFKKLSMNSMIKCLSSLDDSFKLFLYSKLNQSVDGTIRKMHIE